MIVLKVADVQLTPDLSLFKWDLHTSGIFLCALDVFGFDEYTSQVYV